MNIIRIVSLTIFMLIFGDCTNQASQKTVIKNNETISPTVKVVFLALLLDILAFTIILPLFPRLLQEYRVREQGDEVYLIFP